LLALFFFVPQCSSLCLIIANLVRNVTFFLSNTWKLTVF
jgi:hypothetical protein